MSVHFGVIDMSTNGAGVKAISVKNPALPGSLGNLQVTFGYGTGEIDMAFSKSAAGARAIACDDAAREHRRARSQHRIRAQGRSLRLIRARRLAS